jgi:hypothetical protein
VTHTCPESIDSRSLSGSRMLEGESP